MGDAPAISLRFVRFQEDHLDRIMEIEQEAYPDPWSETMFRQELDNGYGHFYSVFLEDVLIGYGGFWIVLDEAHIASVTVREEYRGRGYGRREMAFFLDRAIEAGAQSVYLEVRVSNTRAQNLYRSMGFEVVGRRRGYYVRTNEDAIVMAKNLDFDLRDWQSITTSQ